MTHTTSPQVALPSSLASPFHQACYCPGEAWSLRAQWEPALGSETPMSGQWPLLSRHLESSFFGAYHRLTPPSREWDLEGSSWRPPFLLIFFLPTSPKTSVSLRLGDNLHPESSAWLLSSLTLGAVAYFRCCQQRKKPQKREKLWTKSFNQPCSSLNGNK